MSDEFRPPKPTDHQATFMQELDALESLDILRLGSEHIVGPTTSSVCEIEELGQKIKALQENGGKMDPAALAETVKAYNAACAAGEDKEFGRLKSTLQPVSDGPFYACPLVAGGPNTKGGLAANAKREVLDWNLQPIPGLYAVGEIASALKFVYQGGGNLTECLVFGQVCGKEVAKLPNRA